MAKRKDEDFEPQIIDQQMGEILSERYLAYALSTIMHRALPDVRDGMKPVHRRLLYAMSQLNLKHDAPPKKSARVVGDVIGKYHPHGDSSVYDAMVRLAQDFAVRYPMVDGQGNFGNIDGDNAAAMRYTEARLTRVAQLMLEGIDQNAVDFRATYDGSENEPVVLPGAFPNILANGSSGIAVGMATNIPPFNVAELCEASLALLENDLNTKDLVKIIKGPDFPTGGVLVPRSGNVEAELLMEALFRSCDLETRFNMNMNVLENGITPRVMPLKEVLQCWLDHQQVVLVRRSQFRLEKVLHRLEVH